MEGTWRVAGTEALPGEYMRGQRARHLPGRPQARRTATGKLRGCRPSTLPNHQVDSHFGRVGPETAEILAELAARPFTGVLLTDNLSEPLLENLAVRRLGWYRLQSLLEVQTVIPQLIRRALRYSVLWLTRQPVEGQVTASRRGASSALMRYRMSLGALVVVEGPRVHARPFRKTRNRFDHDRNHHGQTHTTAYG